MLYKTIVSYTMEYYDTDRQPCGRGCDHELLPEHHDVPEGSQTMIYIYIYIYACIYIYIYIYIEREREIDR